MKKSILLLFLGTLLLQNSKAQLTVSVISSFTFYQVGPTFPGVPINYGNVDHSIHHDLVKSGSYWYITSSVGMGSTTFTYRSTTCNSNLYPPTIDNWETAVAGTIYSPGGWIGTGSTIPITISGATHQSVSTFTAGRAYVNASATGLNNGSSWVDAYKSLDDALRAARTCGVNEIWVANGTYKPSEYATGLPYSITSTLTNRDYIFHIVDGVKMYGGFVGTETAITNRIPASETILSGDLAGDDFLTSNNAENCYHLVTSVNDSPATLLDKFTIKGGNANGTGSYVVETQTLAEGGGAGMINLNSSPTLNRIVFLFNQSNYIGGAGMKNISSSPTISNCFFGSSIVIGNGGAMFNKDSSPSITNSIFASNTAVNTAAAIFNENSNITILNSTFRGNSQTGYFPGGAGILNDATSTSNISNSIFKQSGDGVYGNLVGSTINYSMFDFATIPGTGNIIADPQFLNLSSYIGADNIWFSLDDGLQLQSTSPAINSSNPITTLPSSDIVGTPRMGIFDRGAYEFNLCPGTTSRVYVNYAATTGLNTGTSWANAFLSLESALQAARFCGATEIWVAKGTYKPSAPPIGVVSGNTQDFTFHLVNNVKMYGGFVGTETTISARVAGNETILSGDINGNDPNITILPAFYPATILDNCKHVVVSVNDNINTLLDNLTIRNGFSAWPSPSFLTVEGININDSNGGGLVCSGSTLKINNVKFLLNHGSGGAIYTDNGGIYITNSKFFQNFTSQSGGAILSNNDNPNIEKCEFFENKAAYGGAICNTASSILNVKKCIFNSNTANYAGGSGAGNGDGGAIKNYATANIENSVFSFNSGNTGPGVSGRDINNQGLLNVNNCTFYDTFSTPNPSISIASLGTIGVSHIKNSIFQLNANVYAPVVLSPGMDVQYCDVIQYSGIYPGTGNINADPLFVNTADLDGADNIWGTADDGLRLKATSPAINASDPTITTPIIDIAGSTRTGVFDMGPYELTYCTAIATGVWSDPSIWSCGHVPGFGDIVTIGSGVTVTLDMNVNVGAIILAGGTLNLSTFTVTLP